MKIRKKFDELRRKGEGAFMPYVCAGDPDEEFTVDLIKTLCDNGADMIELGIPFSDPVADGPTIQRASMRALRKGMNPEKAISIVRKVRKMGIDVPITIMTYYNVVYKAGIGRFIKKIKEAGAQAILAPDVPIEESRPLLRAARKHRIDVIFLVSPTITDDRLKKVLSAAKGFVYIVAVTGTTGARKSVEDITLRLIKKVRRYSRVPTAVGFGISRPSHAESVIGAGTDGVIVGSEIINTYENERSRKRAFRKIATFSRRMKKKCVLERKG